MKKVLWIVLLALTAGSAVRAQAPGEPDSTMDAPLVGSEGNGSLFVKFSATVKELNKVQLVWDADSTAEGDYFVMERSSDGVHFETIGAVRRTAGSNHYEWSDLAPPNGSNLYRVRYSGQDGRVCYSRSVPLSLSGDLDFKFYPNPVDKLFIIRSEHAVEIQVVDPAGNVRLGKRLQSGVQVVNISSLDRGIYVLRVADKESNRTVTYQLIKN